MERSPLPMPVATKGGLIGLNPTVQVSHRLLGEPSAIELVGIIASARFGAEFRGPQSPCHHRNSSRTYELQARSLALLAGAKEEEVPRLVSQLLENKPFNLEKGTNTLTRIEEMKELRPTS